MNSAPTGSLNPLMNQDKARPESRSSVMIARVIALSGAAISTGSSFSLAADPYADFLDKANDGLWLGMVLFVPAACFANFYSMTRRRWLSWFSAFVGFLIPFFCWPLYFKQQFPTPEHYQSSDYWELESVEHMPIQRWATHRKHQAYAGSIFWGRHTIHEAHKIPVDAEGMPVPEYSSHQVSLQTWNCPRWQLTYFGPFSFVYVHHAERYSAAGRDILNIAWCTRGD
ncbi:hypothetical protein LMG26689_02315 [Achromobacter animicus]|uniref:hypothetical protein n=1 Tax=Achromobacter animicus TaxID=1389935 RepID=UPI0014694237|nr:hypothetical protein [Achromobacter animicus]CAB3857570.1 hypothetical protein LMG26689_02315 [Achromobacter animicus]